MNLNETQKAAVTAWIADGLKLSEIQNRLGKEHSLSLTYIEVRFLVDDLKLVPKDPPAPPVVEPKASLAPAAAPATATPPSEPVPDVPADAGAAPSGAAPAGGSVKLTVDKVTRTGTLVSGEVTFSDGMKAVWYLDQAGRLGVVADQKGYKPSPADVQQFQLALESEMAKLGY